MGIGELAQPSAVSLYSSCPIHTIALQNLWGNHCLSNNPVGGGLGSLNEITVSIDLVSHSLSAYEMHTILQSLFGMLEELMRNSS